MMKTVCVVFIVGLTMENLCASVQQYTVHACKDGTLRLNCLSGVIQVHYVVHADSSCAGRSCCPRQNDCRGSPSATYRNQVNAACNGQSLCAMNVEIRNIGCGLFPNNDYTNITYSCIVVVLTTQTLPASTTLTTTKPSPTTLSSTSTPTWKHSTTSTSTPINTHPYTADDMRATETEKEDGDTTTSQSSLEASTRLNSTHAQKTGKYASGSEQDKSGSHVQTDEEDKGHGYLDRINTMVTVILTGVVITAIVISVAVVLVLRKRRSTAAKSEEQYDMPNLNNQSCNANNDYVNVRTSNVYDSIPDPGDICTASNYTDLEYTTAKESDYLTPVTESNVAPYITIR